MSQAGLKRGILGLSVVLIGGALGGALAGAFVGLRQRHPLYVVLRDLAWQDFSWGRFAWYGTCLAILFLLAWGLTNFYIHRRTGAPLAGLLLRDAFRFLAGAPLVAALVAFGPADARPLFLGTAGLLSLAVLAWKLHPFLKAALFSSDQIRKRDVFAAVLALGLGFFLLDHPRSLTGDEPHYLVLADSLARDRDVDVSNNYDPRVTGRFFGGNLDPTGQTVAVASAEPGKYFLRPVHYPGLAVLIAPGYALGGACGAKLVVTLLTAAGLTGLFVLLRNLDVEAGIAARGVAVLACTSPFITYGLQLYPEMIAGAGLVWGVAVLSGKRFGWTSALCVGGLAAALPWLHVRYLPLSATLTLAAAVRCFRAGADQAVLPDRGLIARATLATLAPLLVSAAGLLGYYQIVYGGFHPGKVSALPEEISYWGSLSWRRSVTYLCAIFLDSQGGVIAYAPALIFAPMGAALLWRKNRKLLALVLLPIALEVALIAAGWRSWHGDWSPPSRFMACVCPLLGALAIVAYAECRAVAPLRWLCHGLFAVGVMFGALMISDPGAMYNTYHSWSIPAITGSYVWIRLGWIFPNYAEAGGRTVALTMVWSIAVCALTWLSLRTSRARLAATP